MAEKQNTDTNGFYRKNSEKIGSMDNRTNKWLLYSNVSIRVISRHIFIRSTVPVFKTRNSSDVPTTDTTFQFLFSRLNTMNKLYFLLCLILPLTVHGCVRTLLANDGRLASTTFSHTKLTFRIEPS